MAKKLMTDQEAFVMLKALEEYIIQTDPIVVIRTPSEIVFTPDGGIRRDDQVLVWGRGTWTVEHVGPHTCSCCPLIECDWKNLSIGDIAFMSNYAVPNFFSLSNYYIILNSKEVVHWDDKEVRIVTRSFNYHYKVEIE